MSLPLSFKPSKNFDLTRLGRSNDGGYLVTINTIMETETLISFGILDDCSFESDFQKRKVVDICCFDKINYQSYWKKRIYNDFGAALFNLNFPYFLNTLKRFFEFKKFFRQKKNLLFNTFIKNESLKNLIENQKPLFKKPFFLKIDIEGGEYRILDELIEHQKSICGLVIEFHDLDLNVQKIEKFIEKFNLELTHIHPNNYSDTDKNRNPTVIEFTFEKRPSAKEGSNNLPNLLDQPCNPKKKEIELNFK